MKRVSSPGMMEKLCQLMIEPGELVISREFPEVTVLTWPATTCIPVGLAKAPAASAQPIVPATTLHRVLRRLETLLSVIARLSAFGAMVFSTSERSWRASADRL